jgi:hypothetical protein
MPGVFWMVIGGGASSHSRLAPRAHHLLCGTAKRRGWGNRTPQAGTLERWSNIASSAECAQSWSKVLFGHDRCRLASPGKRTSWEEGNKCELAKFPKADRLDRLPVLGGGDFAASYIRQKCGCSMLNLAFLTVSPRSASSPRYRQYEATFKMLSPFSSVSL